MKHELENLHNVALNSNKKPYSSLKISRLGSLTQLTQGGTGSLEDGSGNMRMSGQASSINSTN